EFPSERQCFARKQAKRIEGNYNQLAPIKGKFCKSLRVAGLKSKMDKLSAYEKLFVEKISVLEGKLRDDENELRRKENIISQLGLQLKEAKISKDCQPEIEEISILALAHLHMLVTLKMLSTKDVVIQNLLSEKKSPLVYDFPGFYQMAGIAIAIAESWNYLTEDSGHSCKYEQ
ncbi:hypothetical protein U1Q18_016955, partial [Sarracenia purpurea var. burkii]